MPELLTMQDLANGHLDVKALGEAANGDENTIVTTRTGNTYPSAERAINTMFKNGGLPAVPFATKALMTASALVDGDYAVVTEGGPSDVGLYIKEEGGWIRSKYDINAISKQQAKLELENSIYFDTNTDIKSNVFEFVDENYSVGVSIDEQANLNANNIYNQEEDEYLKHDYSFMVLDENRNVALALDNEGNLHSQTVYDIENRVSAIEQGGTTIKPAKYRKPRDPLFKTDYMHVFSYGQSLSRGHAATPVSSTTQPYNNKTFLSGVLFRAKDGETNYTGLKPLIEEARSIEGETPLSSMLNNFVEKRVSDGASPQNWTFIGTAPGQGGAAITVINKGTETYNGMITQVQAAYDIAQTEGKTYSVWALAWSHGEADYRDGTPEQTYYNQVKQLRSEFFIDVQGITKQEYSLPFVMYQSDAHMYYGKKELTIATAQLRLSNETEDFILATPVYQLPKASDKLHLNTSGSMTLGKYYAKALDYTLFTGEKWQPLQPKSVLLQGKILSVDFNKKGLVFDTTTISETPNKGFDIWDGANRLDIITSVSFSDSNRINIILSTIPPIGATLSYGKGRGGTIATEGVPRGNLRDSDSITDTYGLDNWCVAFERKIQS